MAHLFIAVHVHISEDVADVGPRSLLAALAQGLRPPLHRPAGARRRRLVEWPDTLPLARSGQGAPFLPAVFGFRFSELSSARTAVLISVCRNGGSVVPMSVSSPMGDNYVRASGTTGRGIRPALNPLLNAHLGGDATRGRAPLAPPWADEDDSRR